MGTILKCDECGILYPQIRMGDKEAEEYLSKSDDAYNADSDFEDPRVEFTDANPVVKLLNDTDKQGRSLDIGAWSGLYTYIFEALGFDSYGLEPQKPAADFAQTKGLNVLHGSFPDTIPLPLLGHKYHLIAMIETIYYLHDLKKSLSQVRNMLEDTGVFLIKTHQGLICPQLLGHRFSSLTPTSRSV